MARKVFTNHRCTIFMAGKVTDKQFFGQLRQELVWPQLFTFSLRTSIFFSLGRRCLTQEICQSIWITAIEKCQHRAMQCTEHHFVSSLNITTIIVIIIVGIVKGALQTAKRQWGIYGAPQVTPEVNHQEFIKYSCS